MTLSELIESRLEWLDDKSVEDILLELASAVEAGPEALERYKQELLEFHQAKEAEEPSGPPFNFITCDALSKAMLESLTKSMKIRLSGSVLQQSTNDVPEMTSKGDTVTVRMPARFIASGGGK